MRRLPAKRLPPALAAAGLATQAAGLTLRAWSMRTLRASYTRTLRADDDQVVVDSGPYAVIRHPGYLGSLLTWAGFALTSESPPVVMGVTTLLGWAYRRRIVAEERLLRAELAGYDDYCDRTKRLLPLLW